MTPLTDACVTRYSVELEPTFKDGAPFDLPNCHVTVVSSVRSLRETEFGVNTGVSVKLLVAIGLSPILYVFVPSVHAVSVNPFL